MTGTLHIGPRLWFTTVIAAVAASAAVPVISAELAWQSTRVRGTVIYLADAKWEEVTRDQDLTNASIRTLRSGHISLEAAGVILDLGPSSVLELGPSSTGSQIRQYVGSMTITTTGTASEPVSVQAGRLAVTNVQGEVEVRVDETSTFLEVHSGTLSVRSPTGVVTTVAVGEYVADASGALLATASAPSAVTASITGGGDPGGGASANGAANGNASGNGNAGGSNNAGGNGNGNANGNGAGNGNGNGVGSGNAGGNGNGSGSPGGNGNGNGPGSNNGSNGAANGNGSGAGNTPEDGEETP